MQLTSVESTLYPDGMNCGLLSALPNLERLVLSDVNNVPRPIHIASTKLTLLQLTCGDTPLVRLQTRILREVLSALVWDACLSCASDNVRVRLYLSCLPPAVQQDRPAFCLRLASLHHRAVHPLAIFSSHMMLPPVARRGCSQSMAAPFLLPGKA